jgi:MHS family proline/betaine transporter-like MFS transporter
VSLVVYGLLCPLAGALSDRIGRRRTYLLGCAGHLLLAVPVFLLLGNGSLVVVFLGLCMFAVSQALLNVMSSVTIVELFPPATRMTSGAVGYNLGLGPVAGSGPLIAAALVAGTGYAIAPALYLCVIALVVGVVLWFFLPETFRRSLTEETSEPFAETTRLPAGERPRVPTRGSGA